MTLSQRQNMTFSQRQNMALKQRHILTLEQRQIITLEQRSIYVRLPTLNIGMLSNYSSCIFSFLYKYLYNTAIAEIFVIVLDLLKYGMYAYTTCSTL
jgi:hypothetical protein